MSTRPKLYHAPSSYYSMIARLALADGGVVHDSATMDIHLRAEQQRPAYVRLNPNMTVPTLVLPDRVLDQSRDIADFALGRPEDDETKKWLDLHYAFPIEELTFGRVLARSPVARAMIPSQLRRVRRRLQALATAHADLRAIYVARDAVFAARLPTFDPAAAVSLAARRSTEAVAILDRLQSALADGRSTLVSTGYGVADTAFTVFLARMVFTGLGAEVAARPDVRRYWQRMQARPSFAAADIWTRFHLLRFIAGLAGIVTR